MPSCAGGVPGCDPAAARWLSRLLPLEAGPLPGRLPAQTGSTWDPGVAVRVLGVEEPERSPDLFAGILEKFDAAGVCRGLQDVNPPLRPDFRDYFPSSTFSFGRRSDGPAEDDPGEPPSFHEAQAGFMVPEVLLNKAELLLRKVCGSVRNWRVILARFWPLVHLDSRGASRSGVGL